MPTSFNKTCIHQFRGEVGGSIGDVEQKAFELKERKKNIGRSFGWKGEWENLVMEIRLCFCWESGEFEF
ncbi:hypothetical protein BSKO_08217 [Bryopsis sp. KO-2023]|nr:hypothetical protein BSKO_08217 [Bryopsis sp. KO-2023]